MKEVMITDSGDGSLVISSGKMDPEEWEGFLPRNTVWGFHVIGYREGDAPLAPVRAEGALFRVVQDFPCLLVLVPGLVLALVVIVTGLIVL
jgi:hypothetical protein